MIQKAYMQLYFEHVMLRGMCHKQAACMMTDMVVLMTASAFAALTLTLCATVMLQLPLVGSPLLNGGPPVPWCLSPGWGAESR